MVIRLQSPAWLVGVLVLLLSAAGAAGQGTFQNLNFEQARVTPTPVNGYGDEVDPALAFPGWTVSAAGTGTNTSWRLYTLYNSQTLDSPAVDLIGPLFPNGTGLTSLQGSYSVVLQYSAFFRVFPFLSQTGLVPADARSISFLISSQAGVYPPFVTLNGVWVPLVPIAGGRLAGDVTAFAGASAELTFSTGAYLAYFDDVRFSNLPIPEPSAFGLSALGALLVGWRALRRRPPGGAI